ncbi:MAG: phosphoglucosamine mutase [Pirellulales bacterium]|nr:phosphoglucosamine mutase [Pirellulales bacterium]
MSEPIISVSGLRGIVGDSLTPEVALRYACAFASTLEEGPLVITRDGRATGAMLAEAIHSGLMAIGRDTIDADVCATPTAGVLVRRYHAAGGIQISASHNPPEYNGMKLFGSHGYVISAAEGQAVINAYRSRSPAWVGHAHVGSTDVCGDPFDRHLELVLATVDVDRIRDRQFRVLLDSNHGAGSELGFNLLEVLGCEVEVLGDVADGLFAHTPEPTAENLREVLPQVVRMGADVGFCQDPDADRLAVIDAAGNYLGEEYTLAMCVDHVLRRNPGPVVTNCSTSRMSEDLAARYDVPFFRSAVGEANVVGLMRQESAAIGGEGNGGVIDPRVGFVRDSFVGMALLLDAMAARELPVAVLAAELPRYEMAKTKITLPPERVAAGLERLAAHFPDAKSDRLDGLRLDWPGKWLLVRASNTEPIVRAMSEAPTRAEADRLCAEAEALLTR